MRLETCAYCVEYDGMKVRYPLIRVDLLCPPPSSTFSTFHLLAFLSLFPLSPFVVTLKTALEDGSFTRFRPSSHTRGEVAAISRWTGIDLFRFCRLGDSTGLCFRVLVTPDTASTAATENLVRKDRIGMVNSPKKKPLWEQGIWHTSAARSRWLSNRLLRRQYWSVGVGH